MTYAVRILCLVLLVELVWCGVGASRQLLRHVPVLPTVAIDDPVWQMDLAELARRAEQGGGDNWRELGEALLGKGYYAEAEWAFRYALDFNARDHASQFCLALCLDRTGRVAESQPEYLRAAELEASPEELISTERHARYAIGKNHLRLGQGEQAEREFRANSGFNSADYQLAKLMIRSGRAEEALPIIAANLQRTPQSLWFQFARYRAMQELGRTEDSLAAADALRRSEHVVPITFNTDFVIPLSNRAGLAKLINEYNGLVQQGDMDILARFLENLIQTIGDHELPEWSLARRRLIEVEFQRSQPERMLELIAELNQRGEHDADLLQMQGAALAMQGQDDNQAAQLWLRAAQMSPNIPLHHILAQHYEKRSDPAAREEQLGQKALLTAKLMYWESKFPEALEAAREATQRIPEEAQAWFYLGETERELGQMDAAVAAYRDCLERNPDHGRAARQLARLENDSRESSK